jgi:AcrR family transcriptional regulator
MLPIATPRRQQAEERREQILDAALRVFSVKGFAGASIRDIAREAGITEGLIYHYFESKEQLEQGVWKERSWRAQLERILAEAAGKSLEQVLREMVRDFLGTLRENGPMVRMCAAESQRNPELAAQHLKHIEENKQLTSEFLAARKAAGEARPDADMDVAAGLLMGCAYSCFLLFGDSDEPTWKGVVDSLTSTGVDTVMHGIAPPQND